VHIGGILHFAKLAYIAEASRRQEMKSGLKPEAWMKGRNKGLFEICHGNSILLFEKL